MFSEIQDTIMEKKINLFHVVVGIIFALIPLFIANRTITNAQLVDGLQILGYGIIAVHLFIILTYHFNKVKEMADEMDDDDTTNPPSTTGTPVMEKYGRRSVATSSGSTDTLQQFCRTFNWFNWFKC
jgi:hypothetical protein